MKMTAQTPLRLEYRNPFLEVNHTNVAIGATRKDFYVVNLGPRSGVVVERDGQILLTQQYRYLIDRLSWEIPGGKVDPGETPQQSAIRECMEETGVRCHSLSPLVTYYPGLDNFDNRTTLFFCNDSTQERPFSPDLNEVVTIEWLSLDRCMKMVFEGEILDALTVTGLLALLARRGLGTT